MVKGSSILNVTPDAWSKIRQLAGEHGAVCVDVGKKGCAGLSYEVSKVNAPLSEHASMHGEIIEQDDLSVVVAPSAILFLIGSQMDVEADELGWKFVFRNPNESGRCGCGLSFYVA